MLFETQCKICKSPVLYKFIDKHLSKSFSKPALYVLRYEPIFFS